MISHVFESTHSLAYTYITLYDIAILLVVALLIRHLTQTWSLWRRLPPGPWGLPFLGYLPFMKEDVVAMFEDMIKIYGPVFGFQLGSRYAFVVNDRESILDALQNPDLLDRPGEVFSLGKHYSTTKHISNSNGRPWMEQRKLVTVHLKQFERDEQAGGLSTLIENEVEVLTKKLISLGDKEEVNLHTIFSNLTRNIMTQNLWGKPFDENGIISGEELEMVQEYILQQANVSPVGNLFYFPLLTPLIRKINPYYRQRIELATRCDKMFSDIIDSHMKANTTDNQYFIDQFLRQMKKVEGTPMADIFNMETLNGNLQLVLLGGTDTIVASVEHLLITLAEQQEIQDKVYQEILNVCGTEGTIKWPERAKLPYTLATIHESQRTGILLPINAIRIAQKDTTVAGYHIPKGSAMFVNFWHFHNDPKDWDEPEKFKPERYLTPDMKSLDHKQHLLSFSAGRRRCPGKDLALVEIFLITVSLIQRFKVLPPKIPVVRKRQGLIFRAINPRVHFQQRNN